MNTTLDCARWDELISTRLDGELDDAEERLLDEHLESCPRCRATTEEMSVVHRAFRVRPAEEVPDLSDGILARAEHHGVASHRQRRVIVGAVAAMALLVAGIVAFDAATAPGQAPELAHISGVATPAREGTSGAVYLEFVNDGGGDTLTGAHASSALSTVLHVTENRDGLLVMLDEETRPIAGHGTTIFGPGGTHVMLNGVTDDLEPGGAIEVTLDFAESGSRTVEVPIVAHTEVPDLYWPTTT